MKTVLRTGLTVLLLVTVACLFLYHENNRTLAFPADTEIRTAYDNGINWLLDNRENLFKDPNVFLWWMLRESTYRTPNPVITELVDEYEIRYPDLSQRSVWRRLFREDTWLPVKYDAIRDLPYYQQYFVAALYCDTDLYNVAHIADQDDPEFCSHSGQWYRPACVTHQIMGLLLRVTHNCRTGERLDAAIATLQDRIALQLRLDPRVVDVYIQRVLMLVESGATDRLRPVWLQRVLDAQLEDGGWSGEQQLIELPGDRSLNFGNKGFSFNRVVSNFHTTTQGIYLMSLLMQNDTRMQEGK